MLALEVRHGVPLCSVHHSAAQDKPSIPVWKTHKTSIGKQGPPAKLGRRLSSTAPDRAGPTLTSATSAAELGCVHFKRCSGCTVESGLSEPALWQEVRAYFTSRGVTPGPLHSGALDGWRRRGKLAVRRSPQDGRPVVGLFAKGSHDVERIPSCVAHHPAINEAAAAVQHCMEELGVSAYDEHSGAGQLRYLQLTVVDRSAASSEGTGASSSNGMVGVQLVLVWNATAPGTPQPTAAAAAAAAPAAAADSAGQARGRHRRRRRAREGGGRLRGLAAELWRCHGGGLLHSIWVNYQPSGENTIFGSDWEHLHGERDAWAALGGAAVCFSPGSFMQANWEAMNAALAAIQQWVPTGATIADLHSGVGTIGLSLAASCQPRWVRAVEINPLAEAPFRLSAQRLAERMQQEQQQQQQQQGPHAATPPPLASQRGTQTTKPPVLEFYAAAAGSSPERWLEGAEVVVVDPPRKGLEQDLTSWLASAQVPPSVRRLIYLSCGFPALRRDVDALLSSGRWELRHAAGFLFFPGTDHIETLAVFDRVP